MILLNPNKLTRNYPDEASRQIMQKTVAFFENQGKAKIKADDHARVWYADFLEFVKQEKLFATLLTPTSYGADENYRWDTWRNCQFNEILGFYGLAYWYTWQVSILGLGPIWMGDNETLKKKAAQLLEEGAVFAFGLSERNHGADIYSTEMSLTPQGDGSYLANGEKYYIGNANLAPMVSTFGKFNDSGEYVFFNADFRNKGYQLIKNVTASQNYVGQYALHDYPITEAEILSKGQAAWDSALNTVNVGKYNLGWASIGICTHALYEAINHAANRKPTVFRVDAHQIADHVIAGVGTLHGKGCMDVAGDPLQIARQQFTNLRLEHIQRRLAVQSHHHVFHTIGDTMRRTQRLAALRQTGRHFHRRRKQRA